jgi:hypothetical protein
MSGPNVPFTTRPELKGSFGMASSTHWGHGTGGTRPRFQATAVFETVASGSVNQKREP